MYPYITYTIGIDWTGYPTEKEKDKALKQWKKVEAKEEKEEEAEATLQDGYEDYDPIRSAQEALAEVDAFRFRFTEEALAESRPLF